MLFIHCYLLFLYLSASFAIFCNDTLFFFFSNLLLSSVSTSFNFILLSFTILLFLCSLFSSLNLLSSPIYMFLAFFPYFFSLLLLPFSLFYCKLFILFFFPFPICFIHLYLFLLVKFFFFFVIFSTLFCQIFCFSQFFIFSKSYRKIKHNHWKNRENSENSFKVCSFSASLPLDLFLPWIPFRFIFLCFFCRQRMRQPHSMPQQVVLFLFQVELSRIWTKSLIFPLFSLFTPVQNHPFANLEFSDCRRFFYTFSTWNFSPFSFNLSSYLSTYFIFTLLRK